MVIKRLTRLINVILKANKKVQRVRAKYAFEGSGDTDDLPFIKNEILTIISRDEDEWWTAKNQKGQKGLIPVNYVELVSLLNNSSHLKHKLNKAIFLSF